MLRKFLTIFLGITIAMGISACSNDNTVKTVAKEGVAPYEMSESDTYLLETLDIEDDANIISFKAPVAAKSLKFNVYNLDDDGQWNVTDEGMVSIGNDGELGIDRLEGTFAMLRKDNYAMDIIINAISKSTYQIKPLDFDKQINVYGGVVLTNYAEIELEKEIPVSIMVYDSGSSMETHCLEEFFTPSEFEGIDLVQAVTLTFSTETY